MQVILLQRIGRLGQMGDIVTVKDGYARNYLLPQKMALRATEANKQHFESQRIRILKEVDPLHTGLGGCQERTRPSGGVNAGGWHDGHLCTESLHPRTCCQRDTVPDECKR